MTGKEKGGWFDQWVGTILKVKQLISACLASRSTYVFCSSWFLSSLCPLLCIRHLIQNKFTAKKLRYSNSFPHFYEFSVCFCAWHPLVLFLRTTLRGPRAEIILVFVVPPWRRASSGVGLYHGLWWSYAHDPAHRRDHDTMGDAAICWVKGIWPPQP